MYVKQIQIGKFRHLKDIVLGPFPTPPPASDLVALAGPNGGGKSSILELVGHALSNAWSLGWGISRSFPESSFEVTLGLTPDELRLLRQHTETAPPYAPAEKVLEQLMKEPVYYRAFNFPAGEYNKNPPLQNWTHELVTAALRNNYKRPLGFFLQSSRTYRNQGFDRNKLFIYEQLSKVDHVWSLAFNTADAQYQDMFDWLVQQPYHYFRRLGSYEHRKTLGQLNPNEVRPADPLVPYDELLQKLFPGYSLSMGKQEIPSNLFVNLPSGEEVPFADLSSGEKEVFFTLAFFLRNDVSNAIIVIDEPEMHLHPELSRLLVRTMQAIKPGNQIWLATHNGEIIDEVGRDKTIYITRDRDTRTAKATPATDESNAISSLRDMFGYSGYIGVAKTMVFLEGAGASADRKVFTRLFPEHAGALKFVPAGGCDTMPRLNAALTSLLESTFSWCRFYLLRDKDYLTAKHIEKYSAHPSGRLRVLSRNQIENYLLDADVIARIETDIFGRPITTEDVSRRLHAVALALTGEVLREMVAFRLNLLFYPQDFSIGKILQGQTVFESDGKWDDVAVSAFKEGLEKVAKSAVAESQGFVSSDGVQTLISDCQNEISNAVAGSSSGWMSMFPGRRILEEYGRKYSLGKPPVLQNCVINELAAQPGRIPEELRSLVATMSNGGSFEQKTESK